MPNIGPFFYVRGKLIFSAVSLSEGRRDAVQDHRPRQPHGHGALGHAVRPARPRHLSPVAGGEGEGGSENRPRHVRRMRENPYYRMDFAM